MDLYLKDKVAIVTGSGRGIGGAIAKTLANEGVRVCVNDIFEERANETMSAIKSGGGHAMANAADVTIREEVDTMVQEVVDEWGTVHILVNNAGIPARLGEEVAQGGGSDSGVGGQGSGGGFFSDTPTNVWSSVMDIITYGVLNCTQSCLQHMLRQEYGSIVSFISDAGRVGEPRLATYSMAKGGVMAFSKALAKEVGRFKINVNCVSPGATLTPALAGSPVGGAGADPRGQERFQALLRQYQLVGGCSASASPRTSRTPSHSWSRIGRNGLRAKL